MKFFILQVVGRPMGSHQHATLESANAEAFRLMQKEKRDVNVYASYDDVLTPTTLLQLVATHTMTIDLDHGIINKDHPEASVVDNQFNDDLQKLGEELGLPARVSATEEAMNATHNNQTRRATRFKLPTPPPGMQWHRTNGWTSEMLPQGWRPLCNNETVVKGDEFNAMGAGLFEKARDVPKVGAKVDDGFWHYRTTRPLTFTHEGREWTWHRAGDPMPCGGERKVEILMPIEAADGIWNPDVLGWRYTDAEKPDDSPPLIGRGGNEICSVEKTQVGGTHYSDLSIQPAEFIEKNKLSFLEGCVVKRMCRHRRKNGVEDLRKAMHEIQLIAKYEYGIDNLMP